MQTDTISQPDIFGGFIRDAIKRHIEAAIEKEIEEAKKRVEREIRKDVAGLTAKVCMQFAYQYHPKELITTVKFINEKQG